MPQPNPKNIWVSLAGVRFLLAMVVLCQHVGDFTLPRDPVHRLGAFNAGAAVIGFLIISGFSIFASIQRDTAGFVSRRFFRIYPVYLGALLIAQIPWLIYGTSFTFGERATEFPSSPVVAALLNLTLLQAFNVHQIFDTIHQSWTLSIEVLFYASALLLIKLPRKAVIAVMFLSMAAFIGNGYLQLGWFAERPAAGVLCLYWTWLFGWLLYESKAAPWAKMLAFMGVLVLFFVGLPGENKPGPTITFLFVGAAFAYGHRVALSQRLSKFVEWLGDLSYPLYLVHLPICLLLGSWSLEHLSRWNGLILAVCSLAGAAILLHCVDYPVRRWRQKQLLRAQIEAVTSPSIEPETSKT